MALEYDDAEFASAEDLDRIRRDYNRRALLYRLDPALSRGFRAARKEMVDAMNLSRGDTVVDMGTGTGENLAYLRDAVGPEGSVIGVDISRGMLQYARKRVDRRGWENVTLLESDAGNLPLQGSVDGIASSLLLEMFEESDKLVEGWIRRVDDGAISNLFTGYSERRFSRYINTASDLYWWLQEDAWGEPFTGGRPGDVLQRRRERAVETLEESSEEIGYSDHFAGLLHRHTGHL